ncbi:hypothetical protein Tco_0536325 [Tanacetum coccineum]
MSSLLSANEPYIGRYERSPMLPKRTSTSATKPAADDSGRQHQETSFADNALLALIAASLNELKSVLFSHVALYTRTSKAENLLLNTKKLWKSSSGIYPEVFEGNVTSSKPQTLEEAITIDPTRINGSVTKHNSEYKETHDH